MSVERLEIRNFRNLQSVSLEISTSVNVFVGDNGSGKTSLLETLNILSTAKSFRNTPLNDLINTSSNNFTVSASLRNKDGSLYKVGVGKRSGKLVTARVNGESVKKVSELAERLPVIVVEPSSVVLIEGGPSERRQYLDMGLFHVEHDFLRVWKSFNKTLKQRNALLKLGNNSSIKEELKVWDKEFCTAAKSLDLYRRDIIERITPLFNTLVNDLEIDAGIDIQYQPGWDSSYALEEILEKNRTRELRYGVTIFGPHKAEIQFKTGQNSSKDFLSRGQKKLLTYALRVSLADLISKSGYHNCTPLLLLDDLTSELDLQFCRLLCKVLNKRSNLQVFITAIKNDRFLEVIEDELSPMMFHVEHGQISQRL